MTNQTNRLDSIVTRQRASRRRDFVFAAIVAFATVIGVTGVQTVAAATAPTHLVQK
jgi:hypothetical protein